MNQKELKLKCVELALSIYQNQKSDNSGESYTTRIINIAKEIEIYINSPFSKQ